MPISYLALDVGGARIGLAVANDVARIAAPLPALANDDTFIDNLQTIIAANQVTQLIVGWPRGLDGQETTQTEYVGEFIAKLTAACALPVHRQDEAMTSIKAEAELKQRGAQFAKGEVDSLSAVYILEDYLTEEVH